MKKIILSSFILFILVFQLDLVAQTGSRVKLWSTTDPFETKAFIENLGQFDKWAASDVPIKFALNADDKIFFTQKGIIFKLRKSENLTEEEREKRERKPTREIKNVSKFYYITMTWQGCNDSTTIEAQDQAQGYFTFGEEGFENIKAKGFEKLVYKNLYPGIDVEYIIPAPVASASLSNRQHCGIKYSIIVHPGADISRIKMVYSGDVDKLKIDLSGNIIIKTPAGYITDHAPHSYITKSGDSIQSNFVLNDNTVSFAFTQPQTTNHNQQTIIIDPWTITPAYLLNDDAAYDVAYDDHGNTYVSGGTYLFKLAKYDAAGNFLWGFTYPTGWCPGWSCYSKFCLLPNSGTVFIGEAANLTGPRVMKIESNGTLFYTTPNFPGNEEIWVMFYNRCTGQLAGFGGGTQLPNNLQLIADTNLSGSTIKNFNYNTTPRNDIASVEMDYNGDFYALMSSQSSPSANHIMKSLISNGYNPGPAFDVSTGYNYYETTNSGIPGFIPSNVSTRSNALALNNNYLFSYDGRTLEAWNKTNGTLLASALVNAVYAGGQSRTHEGIAVDDCNQVYVGGNMLVHVYTFNGTAFTALPSIPSIPNEVYDVRLDKVSNTLRISGLGFVAVVAAYPCNSGNVLSISHTIDNCYGSACVTVSGGVPSYSYLWSNGATTNCISGLQSGTYIVTVSDNSCIQLHITDTVTIARTVVLQVSGDTVICAGSCTVLTASGASTYTWTPAAGLSATSGAVVTASPMVTTVYTITGITNGCPGRDSIRIHVKPRPAAFLGNDTLLCGVSSVTLNAANPGFTYLWSTGDTTQTIAVTADGSYSVTVNGLHCTGQDTISVHFVPPPVVNLGNDTTICPGTSLVLDAQNPGAGYLWSTGATTQTINVSTAGNYWVIVTIGICVTSDTIQIHVVPEISLGRDQSLCFQPQDTLGIDIDATSYHWSTGDTTHQIIVSEPGQYWLSVFHDNCILTDTVNVTGGFTSLYIPNAFTPDNNGLNDYFRPYGIGVTAFDMKIFTRWGEEIFETMDMNLGWDGRYKGGKAQMGVYVYVITYQTICEGNWNMRRYGSVMLVR